MLRTLHAWPGLIAGALVAFMALTGAVLALQPVLGAVTAASGTGDLATLAAGVMANVENAQSVVRLASGELIAYAASAAGPAAYVVDATGNVLGAYQPSAFFQFFTELHRAFLAGDSGRMVAGLSAAALAVLSLGGIFLLAQRLGGWRKLFSGAKGTLSQRLHVELSRIGVIVLSVLSLTGLVDDAQLFRVCRCGRKRVFLPARIRRHRRHGGLGHAGPAGRRPDRFPRAGLSGRWGSI